MVKVRVVPTLLWSRSGLMKGTSFDAWRCIGAVLPAVKVYCLREVDELILLDIEATSEERDIRYAELEELSRHCRVPLTVGGGVKNLAQVRELLLRGADKVLVNSWAYEAPELINEIAEQFGSQGVVACIDVKRGADDNYHCFSHRGTRPTGRKLQDWATELQKRGVGEILIQSIERDGTLTGYDCGSIAAVVDLLQVPLIISGGCSGYPDMLGAIEAGASAVAASGLFQFTQSTPKEAKSFLAACGILVRV